MGAGGQGRGRTNGSSRARARYPSSPTRAKELCSTLSLCDSKDIPPAGHLTAWPACRPLWPPALPVCPISRLCPSGRVLRSQAPRTAPRMSVAEGKRPLLNLVRRPRRSELRLVQRRIFSTRARLRDARPPNKRRLGEVCVHARACVLLGPGSQRSRRHMTTCSGMTFTLARLHARVTAHWDTSSSMFSR